MSLKASVLFAPRPNDTLAQHMTGSFFPFGIVGSEHTSELGEALN